MQLFLTENCLDLQGKLNPALGYSITKRGDKFFSIRNNVVYCPAGHWRFIELCLELWELKLYISDVVISGWEVYYALIEFGWPPDGVLNMVNPFSKYNAAELSKIIKEHGL